MNAQADLNRLQRLLGGEALAGLRHRLRERYARETGGDAFTLGRLAPQERAALEGLLGRRASRAGSMRLSQAELDAALARAGLAASLEAALEGLDGPIARRKTERLQRERRWNACFDDATDPLLHALLATASGRGFAKRLAGNDPDRAGRLLADAARVLARLPAHGMPLARLAAETCGDAHALDPGRGLASLVLAAARTDEENEDTRTRDRWAQLGVSVNELAAPALLLNLPAAPDTPGGRLAEQARALGEPLHLSLRTLLRDPPRWQTHDRSVFVCENANLVAIAADALGAGCAPLVCTDGMPSAAQRTLLEQLVQAGARLRYHGDFDWPGLRIGNFVMRRFGAAPWRYGAEDYERRAPSQGRTLGTATVSADWDPALSGAMRTCGYALDEERVADTLLGDLAAARAAFQGPE